MKRLSLIVGTSLLTVVAFAIYHVSSGRPQVVVSLIIRDNRIFMDSNIGEILLDTGSPISLMDEELAKHQNLHYTNEQANAGDLAGNVVPAKIAVLDELKIPAKRTSDAPWIVKGLKVAVARGLRKSFEPSFVLGLPAFQKVIVDLDLRHSELRLLGNLPFGPHCKRVPLQTIDGAAAIPLYLEGAEPVQAIIDTGHDGFVQFGQQAWPKVRVKPGSKSEDEERSFFGKAIVETARAEQKISFGNLSVLDAPVMYRPGGQWNLIGVSMLRHTRVAIDWDGKVAVFQTPSFFGNHIKIKVGGEKSSIPDRHESAR